ncbi:MAG: hypothetical protein KAS32_00165 [Candidatus Peribacteraceae bacterium]|nr:hypothetical protein [Candidatus Peribacteraceae bacterium]
MTTETYKTCIKKIDKYITFTDEAKKHNGFLYGWTNLDKKFLENVYSYYYRYGYSGQLLISHMLGCIKKGKQIKDSHYKRFTRDFIYNDRGIIIRFKKT